MKAFIFAFALTVCSGAQAGGYSQGYDDGYGDGAAVQQQVDAMDQRYQQQMSETSTPPYGDGYDAHPYNSAQPEE